MSHNRIKKAAVLTGLTALMGAEVSSVEAASYTVDISPLAAIGGSVAVSATINANQFNGPGTLTGVTFDLTSTITPNGLVGGFGGTPPTSVKVNGHTLGSTTSFPGFNFDVTDNLVFANAAFYSGSSTFPIALQLGEYGCEEQNMCAFSWTGTLEVTFDTTATPLPASLPLLATGLGGLGLAAWRSRRKQKSAT
jgi:hypothetical protein